MSGKGYFDWYPAQAKTREQVIKAIEQKRKDLLREAAFFETGLRKLASLEERKFYELTYLGEIHFLVQCWKFGRDHVEFRIFACDYTQEGVRLKASILKAGGVEMSLHWQWDWETKEVDAKDAPLYVGYEWKTEYFEKLLKGKYRSCNTHSNETVKSLS